MIGIGLQLKTYLGKPACIGAVVPADHHHAVNLPCQDFCLVLPHRSCIADRIENPQFLDLGKTYFNNCLQCFVRLRCLGNDTEAFHRRKRSCLFSRSNDSYRPVGIRYNPFDFRMVPVADYQNFVPFIGKQLHITLGLSDKRTGCIDHFETLFMGLLHLGRGHSVRTEDYPPVFELGQVIYDADTLLFQPLHDLGRVNDRSQGGGRDTVRSLLECQQSRPLDPETKPCMLCDNYVHAFYRFSLAQTRLSILDRTASGVRSVVSITTASSARRSGAICRFRSCWSRCWTSAIVC